MENLLVYSMTSFFQLRVLLCPWWRNIWWWLLHRLPCVFFNGCDAAENQFQKNKKKMASQPWSGQFQFTGGRPRCSEAQQTQSDSSLCSIILIFTTSTQRIQHAHGQWFSFAIDWLNLNCHWHCKAVQLGAVGCFNRLLGRILHTMKERIWKEKKTEQENKQPSWNETFSVSSESRIRSIWNGVSARPPAAVCGTRFKSRHGKWKIFLWIS